MLSVIHFLVDFSCTALLSSIAPALPYSTVIACALIYNGLAFAFQLPIGALADRLNVARLLSAAGCMLIVCGCCIREPFLLCSLIGLGNACFHSGGGREVLQHSGRNASQIGIFVAPGALGIFLGPKLAAAGFSINIPLAIVLIISGFSLCLIRDFPSLISTPHSGNSGIQKGLTLLCMFLTVLLRSYTGTVLRYDFLKSPAFAFAFTGGIFLGKLLGGIFSDKYGTFRFCLTAQILGAILFPLSISYPALALPAIFLFNTTMAVTASKLYAAMPDYPGTMFGLTTFALYLGGIPRLLGWENIYFTGTGLFLLSGLSAFFLLAGLSLHKESQ